MTINTPLATDDQTVAAQALQGSLADLLDLSLNAKQAHWTVVGPLFRSLHEELDELASLSRDFADRLAERSAAIGRAPDGRPGTITATSGLSALPAGWIKDSDVRGLMTTSMAVLISRMRQRVEDTSTADPVTQDLLINLTGELERQHWMLQAQSSY
ncbi:DNA starvation/stationary phase protection protein [Streptomyces poriferorum]|uniref:Dps family protein n=1 Tax=Streptomyces poriferorum TaxID=2798799 RepID=UPI00273E46A1|nr:DNA starvation/stationary phase protection protein [Streptomyces sp. Alt1]WLQ51930.1 DNA starvation/stationary phase protection protein [Streptomyces sp. Alt1]